MSAASKPHMLDHEAKIFDYQSLLERFKRERLEGLWSDTEIEMLEAKLEKLKNHTYSNLEPWQRVQISRHPSRPKALAVIHQIAQDFEELFGDRLYRDDPALIGGLATIDGVKTMVFGQEKGSDLDSRMARNFGMMHPEGYRKALRLMKLAEKFSLPVLCLIDTPGAYPGLESEQRGIAGAIAENLKAMSRLRTQVIAIVLAEGCSGGALGIGVCDVVGMMEHAYYSVISPEGCASILWKDTSKKEQASKALKFTAEELIVRGIIDEIINEPLGGAHHQVNVMTKDIREFYLRWLQHLRHFDLDHLIRRRYDKYRHLGAFENQTPASAQV
jgi:acetyl-CoA carboxylase carboxyl transferase subunit alpha